MQLNFERAKLAKVLNFVKNAIPKKEVEAILNNFYFKVLDSGTVQIVSTDLDLMSVAKCDCTVTGEGAVTIPGERLLRLVNKLTGDKVAFDCEGNSVKIKSGNYSADFKTPGLEDYPEVFKIVEEKESLTFKRETFLGGLKRIYFAVNNDEAKKNLMAVQVSSQGMVASDGKVTAIYKESFNVSELCISSNVLKDLIAVMDASAAEEFSIYEEDAYLVFKFGSDLFFTRKTSVNFPEVFKRIDEPTAKQNKNILRFKVKDLKAVIQRVCLTASEESRSIKFALLTAEDVEISARDNKDFSSKETMKYTADNIDTSGENPIEIVFNYEYLMEILSKMAGEEIEFKMNIANIRQPARIEEGKITILVMRSLLQ